jgi:hypothetical protein
MAKTLSIVVDHVAFSGEFITPVGRFNRIGAGTLSTQISNPMIRAKASDSRLTGLCGGIFRRKGQNATHAVHFTPSCRKVFVIHYFTAGSGEAGD